MDYYPFPAVLRSNYNSINEFGQAEINPHNCSIDFASDFVPLVPLGTDAEVNWLLGTKCIASYRGSVYLSSKNFLRIIDVNPALLEDARKLLSTNIQLPSSIIVTEKDAHHVKDKLPRTPVDILYLSNNIIKLRANDYIREGQKILLSTEVDFLTLHNQALRVKKRVLIRKDEALLICQVLPGGDDNLVALSTYSARLEKDE